MKPVEMNNLEVAGTSREETGGEIVSVEAEMERQGSDKKSIKSVVWSYFDQRSGKCYFCPYTKPGLFWLLFADNIWIDALFLTNTLFA